MKNVVKELMNVFLEDEILLINIFKYSRFWVGRETEVYNRG
jgi:hypothetical protein